MPVEFMEESFELEIRSGVVVLQWPSGAKRVYPLAVFRSQIALAARTLAEFDASRRVLPIGR